MLFMCLVSKLTTVIRTFKIHIYYKKNIQNTKAKFLLTTPQPKILS